MARKPRIEFKGAVYHVIQRGNNKEYIFDKNANKFYFLNKLKEFKEKMNYEVFGYVLMDNHYHLVIKCYDSPLSSIMLHVNRDYSKYYNITNNRTGHVFQDRYKGILVQDDKYLLSLLRYVHQNPVKAKMYKKVAGYYWSSDSFYRRNLLGEIVDINFILDIFSLDRKTAVDEYIKFMDSTEMEDSAIFEDVHIIGELMSEDKKIKSKKMSLDDILHEVCENDENIFCDIKSGSRKRILTQYKKAYIEKSLSVNYTMKEIGNNIGISEVAVLFLNNKE